MRKQRTLTSQGGEKIKIVSSSKTYMGNPSGFSVWVNDNKYFIYCLQRETAEQVAYEKWLRGC